MSNPPLLSLSPSSLSMHHHLHHHHDNGGVGDHHHHQQEPLYHVDSRIWKACAGSCIDIPPINSRVYYFPQGHIEQFSSSSSSSFSSSSPSSPQSLPLPFLSPDITLKPSLLCRVTSVLFLANPHTDEAFVKLLLTPLDDEEEEEEEQQNKESHSTRQTLTVLNKVTASREKDKDNSDKVYSFAKVLTPSDANNGGGFSVPRFCADSIFPPLNYDDDPPVQTLSVTDVRGVVWNFRHIYRGTPRRHLLTTGWSKFVNSKKLVAGDSVVFMKDSQGNVFAGIRRAVRQNVAMGEYSRWRESLGLSAVEEESGSNGNSNGGFGRRCDEVVMRAVELAMAKKQFEVTYYPRPGCPEFVVRAEVVEKAKNAIWEYGMRVKMAVETEDSSRITWFQGTVNGAVRPVTGPWRGSLWRMLMVNWDESDVLPNARTVNPWQIEVVTTLALDTSFPPPKKFRCSGNSEVENQDMHYIPFPGFTRSPMGFSIPRVLNPKNFPAGMQGARQDAHNASTYFRYFGENGSSISAGNFYGYMLPETKTGTVSTELNIGSSPSECLSPDTPSSGQCSGVELQHGCNITKPKGKSFQLFGAIIELSDTVPNGIIDGGCTSDDSSKGSCGVNGSIKPSDIVPSHHCIQLLQRFDEQGQGDSVV